jgi:uncharacterized protein
MMTNNRNKYALITGATSGIGYELARLFAEDEHNLILIGRRQETLDDTTTKLAHYDIDIQTIAADLSIVDAGFKVFDEVKRRDLIVDVLVNDAGQGNYGPFFETDLQKDISDIQLNVTSLVVLTKLFLRDMHERNEGKILQLASVASLYPAPLQAVYGGTKAFVLSFSEALAEELKDTNITVTALLPGATDTDFFNKAGAENSKMVQESNLSDPAKVAKDGYDALMKGELKIVSGVKNKLIAGLSHIMPDSIKASAMRKQTEEKDHHDE